MSLWQCIKCGCSGIAHDLGFCPQCFEERDMPKTTSAGPSAGSGESDQVEAVEEAAPVAVPVTEVEVEPTVTVTKSAKIGY